MTESTHVARMNASNRLKSFAFVLAAGLSLAGLTACGSGHSGIPFVGSDDDGPTSQVRLTPRTSDGSTPDSADLHKALEILQKRVDAAGDKGSSVELQGTDFVISVPGDDTSKARALAKTARLYIRPVLGQHVFGNEQQAGGTDTPGAAPAPADNLPREIQEQKQTRQSEDENIQQQAMAGLDCSKPDPLQGNDDPKLPLVTCSTDGTTGYILGPSIIDGQEISDAAVNYDAQQARQEISLSFKKTGSEAWAKYTGANLLRQAAFTLDSKVISAPTIQGATPAGSATSITGSFTAASAKQLAGQLKYGSLPFTLTESGARTTGGK